ncbi:MAG: DUF4394 domain-containing protein [Acidobacteriia bacterium]|nr:DUF4394 domain-containing protein [Terriglobia bacterium]
MRRSGALLVIVALLVLAPMAAGAQSLYGTEYGGGAIYRINPADGTYVTLGAPGPNPFPGLAYDPGTNTLYGTDEDNLYTVNLTTGAATLVGAHGVAGGITGLTFNAAHTVLYSIGYDGILYSVNPATGAATSVGALGVAPNDIVDLATDSAGTVYAVGTAANLYSVNTTTGAATLLGALTGTSAGLTAIAFDDSDVLYAIDTGTDRLMTVNVSTRVATPVSAGAVGTFGDIRGLAFVGPAAAIPALGGLGLLLLGLLLAVAGWIAIRR